MSPLTVRMSTAASWPVHLTSADTVSTRHDEPSGSSIVASTDPWRRSADPSGTLADSVPRSTSTRAPAWSVVPGRLPMRVTVAVRVSAAVTVTLPDRRRICSSTGSSAGNSQEDMTWVLSRMGAGARRLAPGEAGDPLPGAPAAGRRAAAGVGVERAAGRADQPGVDRRALARRPGLDPGAG